MKVRIKNVSRPLKYTDIKQVEALIDEYFKECDERGAPYTLIGLSNKLDINRSTLYRYKDYKACSNDDIQGYDSLVDKTKAELCTIITRAVEHIEQYTVERLFDKDSYKGAQFLLACNYGYRNTQVLELQSDKDINISID